MTENTLPQSQDIRLQGLSVGYAQGRRAPVVVAGGIGATARGGQLTCLIGRNGTGKSTLLRTLAGFQQPLAGSLTLAGQDLTRLSLRQRARLVSVVLTQRPDLVNATAREVVALGRSPHTGFWGTLRPVDLEAVARAMRLTATEPLAQRRFSTLSDGERQRVMVAKALAQATPVVLLDEPTAFLDYPSRAELMLLLCRLAHEQQKTVLLSTHDLDLALRLADHLWLMTGGSLVEGTAQELTASGHMQQFAGPLGER